MIGEYESWSHQVNATLALLNRLLAAQERRLRALEARVERLDTHSGELAGEVLDVIGRLDASQLRADELEAQVAGLSESLVAHQEREGRHR